jgi:hypothetical protein
MMLPQEPEQVERTSTMVGRVEIERSPQDLNTAENARPRAGIEETIAAIDRKMAPSVEGWMNGEHRPNREAERARERLLFTDLPDYHRSFDRVIIDPPFAVVAWRTTATSQSLGRRVEVVGSSHFEFSDGGDVLRYWIYVDLTSFTN